MRGLARAYGEDVVLDLVDLLGSEAGGGGVGAHTTRE